MIEMMETHGRKRQRRMRSLMPWLASVFVCSLVNTAAAFAPTLQNTWLERVHLVTPLRVRRQRQTTIRRLCAHQLWASRSATHDINSVNSGYDTDDHLQDADFLHDADDTEIDEYDDHDEDFGADVGADFDADVDADVDADYGGNSEGDEDVEVSDAEALLACFTYLQRRKKMGSWKDDDYRKMQKAQVLSTDYPYDTVFMINNNGSGEDDDDGDEDAHASAYDFADTSSHSVVDSDVDAFVNVWGVGAPAASRPTQNDADHLNRQSEPSQEYPQVQDAPHDANGDYDDDVEGEDYYDDDDDDDDEYIVEYDADSVTAGMDAGGANLDTFPGVAQLPVQPANIHFIGEFTSFPSAPTESRIRRSQAAQRKWSNPEFRSRWYEKRWGHKLDAQIDADKNRQLLERVRALPQDFMGSAELASMSEDQIRYAIQSYVAANKKRARSHHTLHENRRRALERASNAETADGGAAITSDDDDDEEPLPRDFLYSVDANKMKLQREQRAKRAQAIYEKRLANQAKKNKTVEGTNLKATSQWSKPSSGRLNDQNSTIDAAFFMEDESIDATKDNDDDPRSALSRIQCDLDQDILPTSRDLQTMLKPIRMPKRRAILRRILSERYQLRGKCIPARCSQSNVDVAASHEVNDDEDDSSNLFVTNAPIQVVGRFALEKILQDEANRASGKDQGQE